VVEFISYTTYGRSKFGRRRRRKHIARGTGDAKPMKGWHHKKGGDEEEKIC
jgi:hypothetical protein